MKYNKLPDPIAIGVFGVATEVSAAADDGKLVKQTGAITP